MTSKQVRKAYKAATKQPTMSRAERIKYEKEQQERIRKELEKEKAARKAKAAREKKKEKEAAEAEAKKKMGMPTVRVRPSQDTIAWFVRGKKRDSGGEVKGDDIIEEAEEAGEVKEAGDAEDAEDAEEAQETQEADMKVEDEAQENDNRGEVEDVGEDLLDDLDLDETIDELLADEEQPVQPQPEQAQAMKRQIDGPVAEVKTPQVDIPEVEVEKEIEAEIVPAAEPEQNDTPGHVSAEELEAILGEDLDLDLDFDDFADEPNLSIDQHKSQTPKPSPAPKQWTPRPSPTSKQLTSKPRSPTPKSSPKFSPPPSFAPPPSTQAILFNLDSFFPSASQQALELEDFSSPPPSAPRTHHSPAPSFIKPPTPTPKAKPPTTAPRANLPSPKAPTQPSQQKPAARSPKRFFTSSGSTEQLSLALHRSRRTAELEEIRQRDRQRSEAGILLRESKRQCLQQERERRQKEAQESRRLKECEEQAQRAKESEQQAKRSKEREAQSQRLTKATEDKENIIPNEIISASQETEYGGDWVDDAAFDLAF